MVGRATRSKVLARSRGPCAYDNAGASANAIESAIASAHMIRREPFYTFLVFYDSWFLDAS